MTNARDIITKYDFGEGIYESIWKLFLAMAFYLAMIVITFGLKVIYLQLFIFFKYIKNDLSNP